MPNRKTGKQIRCSYCGALTYKQAARLRRHKLFFCCNRHRIEYRRKCGGPTLGRKHSEETKSKLREHNSRPEIKKRQSEMTKKQWANGFRGNTGRKHTKEELEKMRAARDGFAFSKETRELLSRLNKEPWRREISKRLAVKNLVPYVKSEKGREQSRKLALRLHERPDKRSSLELAFRSRLERQGITFSEQYVHPDIPFFTWDFAVLETRTFIEIDGCYWHGCEECGYEGIDKTKKLDAKKNLAAKKIGWKVLRFKEHQIEI